MISYIQNNSRFLNHFNVGAVWPNLWSCLTIPSEGQDIGTRFNILRDLNVILESPAFSFVFLNIDFSPFWSRRISPFSSSYSRHFFPFAIGWGNKRLVLYINWHNRWHTMSKPLFCLHHWWPLKVALLGLKFSWILTWCHIVVKFWTKFLLTYNHVRNMVSYQHKSNWCRQQNIDVLKINKHVLSITS